MKKQKMRTQTGLGLLYAVTLAAGTLLLSACSTTPDESYKESEMAKPLDYPPDLVAPVADTRFSVPSADAAPVSTPISLPASSSPPSKRTSRGGGHAH